MYMNLEKRMVAAATSLFVALSMSVHLAGQQHQEPNKGHARYKFIDLGTFGGPASYFSNGFDGVLNNRGISAGWADTSTPDPYPAFCFNLDCFVSHAFQSQNGIVTDLGALPGGASSSAFWSSPNGLIAGNSQNGQLDPLAPGLPENHAVIWRNNRIINLGTLEGGYESFATAVNSRGQAVGLSLNTVPDSFSYFGSFYPYQGRAFLWENGVMHDLGTLGGTDAQALGVNEIGQIYGQSYTNSTPNPVTGLPTADPFLWEKGRMLDLGTLGGTFGLPYGINNRGQVVGTSNLAGDIYYHPFVWTEERGMQDLGTLGGNTGLTNWINDAGEIAGKTDLPGPSPQNHDAVLWRNGVMTDLGTLPGDSCSNAYYVNLRGQVVGTSEDQQLCSILVGHHAFLWENGGPMIDLNTLIPPGSSLELTIAVAINDRGEIAGFGVPVGCSPQDADTCGRAFVLVPCVTDQANTNSCDDGTSVTNNVAPGIAGAEVPSPPN
jgi:probable HAF family extracellular repeat protein